MADVDEVAPETRDALLATMRQASGHHDLEYASPPTVLRGGYYAEMVRFSLADPPAELAGQLVARIVPSPEAAAWEGLIQGNVASQGFPTPAIRLMASEDSPLGRSLLVMDHVDGTPPMSGLDLSSVGRFIPDLLRHLPDQLASLAASLHALDPEPLATELAALEGGFPTTTTGFVERQMGLAAASGRVDLVRAGERLVATEPVSTHRVISHGDLHPFNVLVTDGGPVLIDWTVARVAHPGFTVGFTDLMLSHPPITRSRTASFAIAPIARSTSRRFLRSYQRLAAPADQITDEELSWHRKVHALRILVELAGWEAADVRPTSHPWLILEPVAGRELGLTASSR